MARDIDGLWSGYYEDHGDRYEITARIAQMGSELRGAMTDSTLVIETRLETLRVRGTLSEAEAREVVRSIRAHVPDAHPDSIVYVCHLPEVSELAGYTQGTIVRFRKSYRSATWVGWRTGDHLFGDEQPAHSVEYEGDLDDRNQRIAGRWWIDPDPKTGGDRVEGRFELWRER